MATLEEYAFPAPPVFSGYWTERAWLRFARLYGFKKRRGPAPSIPHPTKAGWYAPICGVDSAGQGIYNTSHPFPGVF